MRTIKSKFYKIIMSLSIVLIFFATFDAYALTASTAFSDPSVTVGNEVNVTMKIRSTDDNIGSARVVLKYDDSALEFVRGTSAQGGTGIINVGSLETPSKEWAYSLTFKALKAGETSITIDSWEIYDTDSKMANLEKQGSSKVTIAAGADSSNNANLSSLSISPGTLNPDFSADTKEYNTNVGLDVNELAVSAVAEDANARVSISGNENLAEGENTVSINIVAEDGNTSNTYTIKVVKAENSDTVQTNETVAESAAGTSSGAGTVNINSKEYKIAENFDASILPNGFEASTYNYGGKTYASGYNSSKNIHILYLIADDGSGDFYSYDESINTWSVYVEINVNSKMITIIPFSNELSIPAELTQSTIEINGKKVQGWINANDTTYEYCVVYAMNESGEKGFYRYDLKEKTIQRYFLSDSNNLNSLNAAYKKLERSSMIKTYLIIILAIIAIIACALLFRNGRDKKTPVKRRTSRKKVKLYDEDYQSDEEYYTSDINLKEASLAGELAKEIESINEEDDDFEDIDLNLKYGMKKADERFSRQNSLDRAPLNKAPLKEENIDDDFEEIDL